jgi:hypothetical protein
MHRIHRKIFSAAPRLVRTQFRLNLSEFKTKSLNKYAVAGAGTGSSRARPYHSAAECTGETLTVEETVPSSADNADNTAMDLVAHSWK